MVNIAQFTQAEFLQLPTEQIAEMVQGLTIGFPIDGTRRWFMLNYPDIWSVEEYKSLTAKQYVAEFKLMFDHGADTLVVPVFGGELMSRGDEYVHEMLEGITRLAQHPTFTEFYNEYNVRVRFYGDWRRQVNGLPGADALAANLDGCVATQHGGPRRIFYGIYADDILVNIVDDMVRSKHEAVEFTREAIVTRYYGEYVKPVDVYIGFGRPTVFDVPMLVTSQTDLYYTTVPSLDLDARLLRLIMWDHFAGRWTQQEWDGLTETDFEALRAFYKAHHGCVLGLGDIDEETGIWYAQGLESISSFRKK